MGTTLTPFNELPWKFLHDSTYITKYQSELNVFNNIVELGSKNWL